MRVYIMRLSRCINIWWWKRRKFFHSIILLQPSRVSKRLRDKSTTNARRFHSENNVKRLPIGSDSLKIELKLTEIWAKGRHAMTNSIGFRFRVLPFTPRLCQRRYRIIRKFIIKFKKWLNLLQGGYQRQLEARFVCGASLYPLEKNKIHSNIKGLTRKVHPYPHTHTRAKSAALPLKSRMNKSKYSLISQQQESHFVNRRLFFWILKFLHLLPFESLLPIFTQKKMASKKEPRVVFVRVIFMRLGT